MRDGKFVVITPDKLIVCSPALQHLKELALPVAREGLEPDWNAVASPGGHYLLVSYDPRAGEHTRFELVDMDMMQVVETWADPGFGGIHTFAVLDEGSLLAINGRGGELVVGVPEGPWRPVRIDWNPSCRPASYRPINNQTILAMGSVALDRYCYNVGLRNGELLLTQGLGHDEFIESVSASSGGRRFAIAIDKVHGASRLLDIGGHASLDRIMVYDLPGRQWTYTLSGKKHGIRSISALALSPAGSLLGLINQDQVLQVYRIPPRQTAR